MYNYYRYSNIIIIITVVQTSLSSLLLFKHCHYYRYSNIIVITTVIQTLLSLLPLSKHYYHYYRYPNITIIITVIQTVLSLLPLFKHYYHYYCYSNIINHYYCYSNACTCLTFTPEGGGGPDIAPQTLGVPRPPHWVETVVAFVHNAVVLIDRVPVDLHLQLGDGRRRETEI